MTEAFCLVVLYWVRYGKTNMGQKWWVTAVLTLAVYPLVGLVLGGLHAFGARAVSRRGPGLEQAPFPPPGLVGALGIIGGLFFMNAVLRQQYFAIPGAVLVLVLSVSFWKKMRRLPIFNWFVRWLPAEGAVFLMGLWAFLFEPREPISLRLVVVASLLAAGGVIVIAWVLRKVWRSFPARWLRWEKTKWAPLGMIWLLAAIFSIGLLGLYPGNDPDKVDGQLPAVRNIQNSPQLPNILLITLDTVRAGHMSVYGYSRSTTPFLERFVASEATLYTRAYSASNGTLSSHAAIFTGLHPSATGAYGDSQHPAGKPIHSGLPVLSETLKAAGYTTLGFVANYGYLSKFYGFGRGFDRYFTQSNSFMSEHEQFFQQTVRDILRNLLGDKICRMYYDAKKMNLLLKKSKTYEKIDLKFTFVNYMDAHWPYIPQENLSKQFNDMEIKIQWGKPGNYQQCLTTGQNIKKEIVYLRNQYDASIRQLDEALEDVVEFLKERGEFDRTLIVITSDHGEALGENGLLMHGVGVTDDQAWVPLIIKFPFQREGKIDARPAGGVDILPTILDVARLSWPHECHGRNLQGALPTPDSAPVVVESFAKITDGWGMATDKNRLEEARFVFTARQFHWDPGQGILGIPGGNGDDIMDSQDQGLHRFVESHLQKSRVWMARKDGTSYPKALLKKLRTLGYIQ
jgi:arylsulfatase A-like enzyme